MIMGADVSHPSPQSRDPSCSALVGTIDRHGVVYATAVGIQKSRVEAIEDLDVMAKELLDRFRARNGTYPKRVIVYRFVSLACPSDSIHGVNSDGVSEGQYQKVLGSGLPFLPCSYSNSSVGQNCTPFEKP